MLYVNFAATGPSAKRRGGAPVAQSVEYLRHLQRLRPRRISTGFDSELRPFAACHPPSVALFPVNFFKKLSCQMKPPKNVMTTMKGFKGFFRIMSSHVPDFLPYS